MRTVETGCAFMLIAITACQLTHFIHLQPAPLNSLLRILFIPSLVIGNSPVVPDSWSRGTAFGGWCPTHLCLLTLPMQPPSWLASTMLTGGLVQPRVCGGIQWP
eukprot:scpid107227/ scgid12730/ 